MLILNRILLPPGFPRITPVPVALVNDLVNSLPEASDVVAAALGATQLRDIISKADDRFTFFAPSNQASADSRGLGQASVNYGGG